MSLESLSDYFQSGKKQTLRKAQLAHKVGAALQEVLSSPAKVVIGGKALMIICSDQAAASKLKLMRSSLKQILADIDPTLSSMKLTIKTGDVYSPQPGDSSTNS